MKVILDDTFIKEFLYPFTATRNAADIRIGILTIREKWEMITGTPITTNPHISASPDEKETPLVMSSNIVPTKKWVETVLKNGGEGDLFADKELVRVLKHPIDIFKHNDWAIRADFELVTSGRVSEPVSSTNRLTNKENIFIEAGARIEHCILNAATGPIYIGKNAELMEGSMIRGPFALGENAVVKMGSKIYGATTIGPYCMAGGEIKNSILFGYSNKAHDGYLGDSVIGEWCNLGAGTTNSNVKNTAGDVMVWDMSGNKYINAGLKCGLLMGDYSRAAINTSFNTGTVVGICCNIFGEGFPPKHVADFSWGTERYDITKAIRDIDNWKKLKGALITPEEEEQLLTLYNK